MGALVSSLGSIPAGNNQLGYSTEVAASGDLSAALAAADDIFVSGDITISSTISLTTPKSITFAHGVTVTIDSGLTSSAAFTTSSTVNFHCLGEWTIDADHSGEILAVSGTGNYQSRGRLVIDSTANSNTLAIRGHFEWLHLQLNNATRTMTSTGQSLGFQTLRVDRFIITGGGTITNINLTNFYGESISLEGTWRANTSPGAGFALALDDSYVGTVHRDFAAAWSMWLDGARVGNFIGNGNGQRLYVGGDSADSIVFPVSSGAESGMSISNGSGTGINNHVYMPGSVNTFTPAGQSWYDLVLGTSAAGPVSLNNNSFCRYVAMQAQSTVTLSSASLKSQFSTCHFHSGVTIDASSNDHRFGQCFFNGDTTINGARNIFIGCYFNGTVTIAAGSYSVFIGCSFNSTMTNNDSTNSRLIGCYDSSSPVAGEINPYWGNNDGKIVFKPTATTDATKTELFIDASSKVLALASNDGMQCTITIYSQRDDQSMASYRLENVVIINNGGTTAITGGATGASPTSSTSTGSTLLYDVSADDTSDYLKLEVTGNALENWKHVAVIEFVKLNN